jgi:hypothetical protein
MNEGGVHYRIVEGAPLLRGREVLLESVAVIPQTEGGASTWTGDQAMRDEGGIGIEVQ